MEDLASVGKVETRSYLRYNSNDSFGIERAFTIECFT